MPGRNLHLPGAKGLNQQVGAFGCHVEKIRLASRFVMGRGRLIHVTQVVQLVAHCLFEPFLLLRIATDDIRRIVDFVASRPGSVEIAILLLRRGHVADELVDIRFKPGSGCVIIEYDAPSMILERSLSLNPKRAVHFLSEVPAATLKFSTRPVSSHDLE